MKNNKQNRRSTRKKDELNNFIFNLFIHDDIFWNIKLKYLKENFNKLTDINKIKALKEIKKDIKIEDFFEKYIKQIDWKNIENPIIIMIGLNYINKLLSNFIIEIPRVNNYTIINNFIRKFEEKIKKSCDNDILYVNTFKGKEEQIIKKIKEIINILKNKIKNQNNVIDNIKEIKEDKYFQSWNSCMIEYLIFKSNEMEENKIIKALLKIKGNFYYEIIFPLLFKEETLKNKDFLKKEEIKKILQSSYIKNTDIEKLYNQINKTTKINKFKKLKEEMFNTYK